jgi:phospholipase C
MSDTRRDFLKKAALLAGAASLTNVLPASIQKAMAINAAEGSTYLDAEHVVILMQENRSFDHTYGTLKGVRGYNDPRAIDLPDKNKVWLQSNAAGETYAPFHLDIKATKATWMDSLPHSWANQTNARNDGKHDQWLDNKANSIPEYSKMPLTLGFHNRDDIPFYYALADAFTICDQNFCSALTGTNPNRLFFWTGTVREEQNENSRAHVWNDDMDYGTLKWTTFPERLEKNGISWKCYQNEVAIDNGLQGEGDFWLSNFQDNPLEFFAQYNIKMHKKHQEFLAQRSAELPGQISKIQATIAALPANDAQLDHLQKQLKQLESDLAAVSKDRTNYHPDRFDALPQYDKNIHLKAFDTNVNDPHYHDLVELNYDDNGVSRSMKIPKGDVLHQFREDVSTGKLPAVSWISAPESFSDHPSAPWYGAWYVSEVLDILTQNPEVWKKTIFILAYDENDGYFDHVPPFTAPHSHKDGTGKVSKGIDTRAEFVTLEQELARHDFPEKFDREGPIGLGFRVPLVIASPWSKGGWVNSEVFDHTSTLQFLETFLSKKTGKTISEPNISNWRRTICGDLTSVFRPYHSEGIPSPQFVAKDTFLEGIHKAQFKKLPADYKRFSSAEIAEFNQNPYATPYMPRQEAGIRPACALPYQIQADGQLSADKKSFEITFANPDDVFGKATAGAPFNVYAPGNYLQVDKAGRQAFGPVRTWAYGLTAGDSLSDAWPLHEFENNHYHLRVYGPNGFYREFAGNAHDPEVSILMDYERRPMLKNKLTGNIVLNLESKKDYTVEITDNAYKAAPVKHLLKGSAKAIALVLNLEKNHHWYDFTVKVHGHESYIKRYAGHVETGKPSYSDPYMGRVI